MYFIKYQLVCLGVSCLIGITKPTFLQRLELQEMIMDKTDGNDISVIQDQFDFDHSYGYDINNNKVI